MKLKKVGKALFFPHIAVMIILLPISTVFLVYSMVFLGSGAVVSIFSYVLALYTLTVWCLKVPQLIRFMRNFKEQNKYAKLWRTDVSFRINASLYGTLLWNTAYAVFHLGLGFFHRSFWFFSMAGYYISLAVMRFFLVRYTHKNKSGENIKEELSRYRTCGWIFLVMNLALSLMIFFMVYWDRTFNHHEITTIALAAYTFTTFIMAIINIVKYRKIGNPVYSASKAISLAAACVSMLTLESTMLTTFNDGTIDILTRKILLGTTGAAISAFILIMSVYMIVQSSKKLKALK